MGQPGPPDFIPTQAQLAQIATHYGLGPLKSWRTLAGGIVNPVLLLNEGTVLRINVREPDSPKVAKEAWVLDFVARHGASHGLRVPAVLGADATRQILPYDYILLEYLPGRPGESAWAECAPAERAALSRQMGRWLASLHALPLAGHLYGGWDGATNTLGTAPNWRRHMTAYSEHLLRHAAEVNAVPPDLLGKIEQWFSRHSDALPASPQRCLVHGDFGLWNMLVQPAPATGGTLSWSITSLLDFEWSQAGPPALDFAPISYEPGDPVDFVAFIEGYTGGEILSRDLLQQTHYCIMQYNLDLLCVAAKWWGGRGSEAHIGSIERLLQSEPAWGFAAAGYAWPF